MKFNRDQYPVAIHTLRWRRSSGLTLVEVAVAAGIGSLILLLVGYLSLYAVRSFATIGNSSILSAKNRIALDRMARDIRQMDKVQYCYQDDTVKWIKFTTTNNVEVPYMKYLWYPDERKVICERPNQPDQTILTECDQWDFVMYQDSPIPGSPNSFRAVTNAADCRMVEFKWAVSRSVLGKEWSGERVQSSRIVLRNR